MLLPPCPVRYSSFVRVQTSPAAWCERRAGRLDRTTAKLRKSSRKSFLGVRKARAYPAMTTALNPARALLAPCREGVVERALAWGALFDGDDGAALVDVDQRHVEPRALLQELQVARAIGVDIRQPHQEEAIGDLHRKSRQWRAAGLLVGFHQDARHVADA